MGEREVVNGHHSLSAEAQQYVVVDVNKTRAPYPERTIHELLQQTATAHPLATAAFVSDDAEDHRQNERSAITYDQLDAYSDIIATQLCAAGVLSAHRRLVAVVFHRSLQMLCAVFGTLKSGGAYVPIAPTCPPRRAHEILWETKAAACLVQSEVSDGLIPQELRSHVGVWSLTDVEAGLRPLHVGLTPIHTNGSAVTTRCRRLQSTPHDLAYVLYTSGEHTCLSTPTNHPPTPLTSPNF